MKHKIILFIFVLSVITNGVLLHDNSQLRKQIASYQLANSGNIVEPGAIKDYLENNAEANFNGKVFCEFEPVLIEDKISIINIYIYAACQEYFMENNQLETGTGMAGPVLLVASRIGQKIEIIAQAAPEFPHENIVVIPRQLDEYYKSFIGNPPFPREQLQKQAEEYFHLQ